MHLYRQTLVWLIAGVPRRYSTGRCSQTGGTRQPTTLLLFVAFLYTLSLYYNHVNHAPKWLIAIVLTSSRRTAVHLSPPPTYKLSFILLRNTRYLVPGKQKTAAYCHDQCSVASGRRAVYFRDKYSVATAAVQRPITAINVQ